MNDIKGGDDELVLSLAQHADVEQRADVAVHCLHVTIYPARRFTNGHVPLIRYPSGKGRLAERLGV